MRISTRSETNVVMPSLLLLIFLGLNCVNASDQPAEGRGILLQTYEAGTDEQKIALLERAIGRLGPDGPVLLSVRLAELPVGPSAVELCKKVLRQDGGSREAYHCLATKVRLMDNPRKTSKRLKRWSEIDPTNSLPLFLLACLNARQGDYEEAIRYIQAGNGIGFAYFRPVYTVLSAGDGPDLGEERHLRAEDEFSTSTYLVTGELRNILRSIAPHLAELEQDEAIKCVVELVKMGDIISWSEPLCTTHFLTGIAVSWGILESHLKRVDGIATSKQLRLQTMLDLRKGVKESVCAVVLEAGTRDTELQALRDACDQLRKSW